MSDFAIPGVSSKYNTDKIIKALMDAERITLVRMESDLDAFKDRKTVWLGLNTKISGLKDSARDLYGFQNPFNEKIAGSSDESILTATASRTAIEEKKKVQVKQIAAPDRFISKSLPGDFTPEKGLYRFQVGDEEVKFNFQGGSLNNLAERINKKGGNLLKASVVNDTKDSQVIVIEAQKTGAKNTLSFHDRALSFGEQAGILERAPLAIQTAPISRLSVQPWEASLKEDSFTVSDGTLTANPGVELKIPFLSPVAIRPTMALELELKTVIIPEEALDELGPPPGPEIPAAGGIEFQGIKVENVKSRVELPEWKPPQPPERIDDLHVLFAQNRGVTQPLREIKDSEEFHTMRFNADELPERIESFNLRNRNTHRRIVIRNIRIFDTATRGDYRPVNPLSTAQDAHIVMDGIEVVRDTNNIDDLTPGVNLTLHSASEEPVNLSIERDKEAIKSSIISFIGKYNQLLTHLDILTRRDETIIEDAQFLSVEEKEKARTNLALLQGDVTLMQLKTSLQRLMMNPYPTTGGRELSMLAQIGIATNAAAGRAASVTLDNARLRGYMQIDETKFDETLSRHAEWIKELFGFDTDRDLVIDSGVAFALHTYLKSYVDSGGIIPNRIENINTRLVRKKDDITAYNRHLEDYERQIRKKYYIMEGALDSLEKSSQSLENLNRQNK